MGQTIHAGKNSKVFKDDRVVAAMAVLGAIGLIFSLAGQGGVVGNSDLAAYAYEKVDGDLNKAIAQTTMTLAGAELSYMVATGALAMGPAGWMAVGLAVGGIA